MVRCDRRRRTGGGAGEEEGVWVARQGVSVQYVVHPRVCPKFKWLMPFRRPQRRMERMMTMMMMGRRRMMMMMRMLIRSV